MLDKIHVERGNNLMHFSSFSYCVEGSRKGTSLLGGGGVKGG